MSRKLRVWFPGASYHITCRGNHRNDIFRDGEDYQVYLNVLEQTMDKYPFELNCYCLMTNHVHLQIKSMDMEIGKIMKMINQIYTLYFNNKYNYVGHLFQGRYFSELIENDAQVLSTSRYIHLNPVRARIVENPVDYEWSSYGGYMAKRSIKILDFNRILGHFKDMSSELYKDYVEKPMNTVEQ